MSEDELETWTQHSDAHHHQPDSFGAMRAHLSHAKGLPMAHCQREMAKAIFQHAGH
jgi:hypothetical protein